MESFSSRLIMGLFTKLRRRAAFQCSCGPKTHAARKPQMMHRVFSPMGNDSFIGSPVRTLKSLECTFPKQEERTTRSKHFPCLAVVDPRVRTLASSNARLYYLGAADYVAGAIM